MTDRPSKTGKCSGSGQAVYGLGNRSLRTLRKGEKVPCPQCRVPLNVSRPVRGFYHIYIPDHVRPT